MNLWRGRIEQDESVIAKQPGKQLCHGRAEIFTGAIDGAQQIGDLRIAQKFSSGCDRGFEVLTERTSADRRVVRSTGIDLDSPQQSPFFSEKIRVVHLGKIMVLTRQPENRDTLDPLLGGFFSKLDGGERLEYGKQRPTEQGYLLSGNNSAGAVLQALDILQGLRRGVPARILRS